MNELKCITVAVQRIMGLTAESRINRSGVVAHKAESEIVVTREQRLHLIINVPFLYCICQYSQKAYQKFTKLKRVFARYRENG